VGQVLFLLGTDSITSITASNPHHHSYNRALAQFQEAGLRLKEIHNRLFSIRWRNNKGQINCEVV
jgi:hypothetical protein